MHRAIFVGGLRTPFARAHKGGYASIRPDDLAIELLTEHRRRYPLGWTSVPEDCVVGCAYPEGEQGYNLARMIAIGGQLPVPGTTVNRLCASSLEAAAIAAARIRAGWGTRYWVAGVESMSRVPRRGANFSESERIQQANPLAYMPNGETAERVAARYPALSRARQEDFAAQSHELAAAAYQRQDYQRQLFPFLIERDEFIRVPVDRAKMASLQPAFDPQGVVTAATSSPLSDGVTCGLVCELSIAKQSGFDWGLELIDAAVAHVAPEYMGLGPIPATQLLLDRQPLSVTQLAAIEINEAFAIQVLATIEDLRLPVDRVNRWGGAIALGHPLGASGLRLLMTVTDRLIAAGDEGAWGLATLCVGGGQGMSVLGRLIRLNA